jgi:hypothetical protein
VITASAAFDVVIGSLRQHVAGSFTLGLTLPAGYSFTRCLSSIQLDAQNTTDLPDGIRDQAGFSTIGGNAVLTGNVAAGVSVVDLLNPDNAASVLYRTQIKGTLVTFSWGVRTRGTAAPELVRKFTGRVTTLELDHEAGTVTLGLTDLSADWDSVPGSPAVVTGPPYNAGLTSEFAMDAVIRSVNGISTWPATRPNCYLAAGMAASIWPEVGAIDPNNGGVSGQIPTFAPGDYGSALVCSNNNISFLAYDLASPFTSDQFRFEMFASGSVTCYASDVASNGYVVESITVSLFPGTVGVTLYSNHGGAQYFVNVPVDSNMHYVGVAVDWPKGSANATVTLQYDGTTSTSVVVAQDARVGTPLPYATLELDPPARVSGVQLWAGGTFTPNYPFVPAAVLDPSLNPLTIVPEIAVGAKATDILQTIAAAELGYARMDENGIYRFTNRQTIATQAVQRTITSRVSLKRLTTYVGNGSLYHHVQVPYSEWTFAAPTNVFTVAAGKRIPARRTTSWTQPMEGVAGQIATAATLLPNGHTFADGNTWYRASSDSAGVTAHPGISISVNQVSPGVIGITAVNTTSRDAYLVSPASYTDIPVGTPSLWVGGLPAVPADEAFVDLVIGDGKGVYTFPSNAYLQDPDTARLIGYWLANQLYTPVRDFTNVEIVPTRASRSATSTTSSTTSRSGIDEYVFVWGWNFSAEFPTPGGTGGSWDETLSLRTVGPPGSWLAGVPGRSEAPTTTYAY